MPQQEQGCLEECVRSTPRKNWLRINRSFKDWGEVFPNAACVVSVIGMHRAEVVLIEGESHRVKEAQERLTSRTKPRAAKTAGATSRKEQR